MTTGGNALGRFLRGPAAVTKEFSPTEWRELVRAAQSNKLLSRVACLLRDSDGLRDAPENIRRRLEGAVRVADGCARSVRWEVRNVVAALSAPGIPVMLLKGAGYEMAELPVSVGRIYADVDIMVPGSRLAEAEEALVDAGWMTGKLDAYDQKYYRTWMHEIPPMINIKRGTTLDVHHTILPPTASLKPDADKLWRSAVELEHMPGVYVLSPADMVLHSAVHLFHDGDMEGGLRDLVDLDALMRDFRRQPGFWTGLLERAQELSLVPPLHYAFRYCTRLLGTPVPERLVAQAEVLGAPSPPAAAMMDAMVKVVFQPSVLSQQAGWSDFLRWLLYVRSHNLRMPPHLLLPHLLRKSLRDGS